MTFADLIKEIRLDWDAHAAWRSEAREAYDFFAGDQWTQEERQALHEAGRAAVTFNRTAPIIDSIIGSEINNRTEVRYIPRELGDAGANEILTGAAQWFRDEADAEEEETDAFQDAVVCGLGWTLTRLDTSEDPEGTPSIERIDPLEVGFDRHAHRRNLRDGRRVFWARKVSLAEAKEMFPGKTKEELHAGWFPFADNQRIDIDNPGSEYIGAGETFPQDGDEVVIVHVQWKEQEKYHVAQDPQTGQRVDLDAAQAKAVRRAMPYVQMVEAKRSRVMQAVLGADFLEKPAKAPNQRDFDFQAITGKRDHNKRRWYGVMRAMKDPQKWANKWMVQTLHIMNSSAKGGIIAESGITDDHERFEENWAKPNSVEWVANGSLERNRIMPKPQTGFPQGFQMLTEFAISSIQASTGVNLEMLGLKDMNQPGVLEYQRRQSAMTILAKMFDALRSYRKRQGRVLLEYITEYLSDGRLIRITGDEGAQYVPLIKQPGVKKYDVIVDESATSPNQKEMTWAFVQQLLPIIGPMLTPEDWALVMKYSPLPESFAAKFAERAKQPPDPAAEMAQQMQMAAAQADLAKTQSETKENQADAMLTMAKAQQIGVETQLAPMRMAAERDDALASRGMAQSQAERDFAMRAEGLRMQERKQADDMRLRSGGLALQALRPGAPARA